MVHITAVDLEQWADQFTASSDFPRLISQLIWASSNSLEKLDMPGGELTRLSGFDGIVDCLSSDDLVPTGLSAWELSVERKVSTKAKSDYRKRTTKPMDVDQKGTTFVFATPRRWPRGDAWVRALKKRKPWKDVRVIWSRDLEKWLARVPWIAASFGPLIARRPLLGIEGLDMIWRDYSKVATAGMKGLDGNFVLANRTAVAVSFLEWISTDARKDEILCISGPSEREILHYLAATVDTLPAHEHVQYESRIFAVYDKAIAQSLGGLSSHHVVLVRQGEALPHVIELSQRCGCRLVVVRGQSDGLFLPPDCPVTDLTLEPISPKSFVASLVSLGYSMQDAGGICATCGYDYKRVRMATMLY
jgi:hypothetical protein